MSGVVVASAALLGAGAAAGGIAVREHTMHRGDYGNWGDVNAYCGEPTHPTWGDDNQVVCVGQRISTGVILTFTDLYVVRPTDHGWRVIYHTKRCC